LTNYFQSQQRQK